MTKRHTLSFTHEELMRLQEFLRNYERLEMRKHPQLRSALFKIQKEADRAYMYEETRMHAYPRRAMQMGCGEV